MIGNIVQIGVQHTAEYLPLAQAGEAWRDLDFGDKRRGLPSLDVFDDIESWAYYGIDSDPNSIVLMTQRYGDQASWILASVCGKPSARLIKSTNWFFDDNVFKGIYAPVLSLEEIFESMGLDHVEMLILDIEGTEIELFDNYQFAVKPRFISVDIHGGEGYELSDGLGVVQIADDIENRLLGVNYDCTQKTFYCRDTIICHFVYNALDGNYERESLCQRH